MLKSIKPIIEGFAHIGWTFYQWRCGGLRWRAIISDNPVTNSPWNTWRIINTAFRRRRIALSGKDYLALVQSKYAYYWEIFNERH